VKGHAAELEIRRPVSLADALDLLAAEPGLRPLAGGTDLMVLHEAGLLGPARLLDLSPLPELDGIRVDGQELVIGAATSYAAIHESALVRTHAPLLARAAMETGARAIQERGSLGGNLANASPAADSAPALLAHGAVLELGCRAGTRRLPLDEFFLDYRRTALRAGELIATIRLPLATPTLCYFRKVGARRAQAITKVSLAACGRWTAQGLDCRLALASVAPVPLRARRTEAFLADAAGRSGWMREAVDLLRSEVRPIDDIRSTAAYRCTVAGNLLGAFLRMAEATRSTLGLTP
jgi:CO/xanthine dehydrogenase FAD-binding subunit